MKGFIKHLILFVIIIAVCDQIAGICLKRLTQTATSGDTARNEYMANSMKAELLVFGSSRAIHHYDPQIIGDSLNMSCYNCGQNGMGIILFFARYKMISERYTPKIIIYDPLYGFDLVKGDNHSYLTWLRPYYDKQGIAEIFDAIDPTEKYKMVSNMYRYNGKILQIISDNVAAIREESLGFRPVDATMTYTPVQKDDSIRYAVDSLKLQYFSRLITACKEKGTQLFFVLSPFYMGSRYTQQTYAPLIKLCEENDIPFLDYFSDSEIATDRNCFYDSYHMNRRGATLFSKKLSSKLLSTINDQSFKH